jgi:hypothetical protein
MKASSRHDGAPELMGTTEVALELGIPAQNVGVHVGFPEPIAALRCGRIWLAEDVRRFAVGFAVQRQARLSRQSASR